jgi:hypothetical protein
VESTVGWAGARLRLSLSMSHNGKRESRLDTRSSNHLTHTHPKSVCVRRPPIAGGRFLYAPHAMTDRRVVLDP